MPNQQSLMTSLAGQLQTDHGETVSRQNLYKRPHSEIHDKNETDENIVQLVRAFSFDHFRRPFVDADCLNNTSHEDLTKPDESSIQNEYSMKFSIHTLRASENQHTAGPIIKKNEENYSEIVECINQFSDGVAALHDDNVQLYQSLFQANNKNLQQQNQIKQLKYSTEENAQLLHATQLNIQVLQTDIDSVKQTVTDALNSSSHDGTFIWKITDVSQKITNAIAENQTSVYSPPFFSSPNGYKMCMRLYFNGDGQARKQFLSIFFVLMRGEYDAILSWPFSYRVTFCLYDQTENQRHIVDSFRPDIKSSSFQRPKSNMNIASGLPKFCSLSTIHSDNNPYVRDNCMFIRCAVDFESLPKAAINYICRINVGLPKHIQLKDIQEEIKRIKLLSSSPLPSSLPVISNAGNISTIDVTSRDS